MALGKPTHVILLNTSHHPQLGWLHLCGALECVQSKVLARETEQPARQMGALLHKSPAEIGSHHAAHTDRNAEIDKKQELLGAMGAVLSWGFVRLVDTAAVLRLWSAQDSLEDTPLDNGEVGEAGAFGESDPRPWNNPVAESSTDEYYDSHSWQSEELSDVSPDREDCLSALLGAEDLYKGWRLENSIHVQDCRPHRPPKRNSRIAREPTQTSSTDTNHLDQHRLATCSAGVLADHLDNLNTQSTVFNHFNCLDNHNTSTRHTCDSTRNTCDSTNTVSKISSQACSSDSQVLSANSQCGETPCIDSSSSKTKGPEAAQPPFDTNSALSTDTYCISQSHPSTENISANTNGPVTEAQSPHKHSQNVSHADQQLTPDTATKPCNETSILCFDSQVCVDTIAEQDPLTGTDPAVRNTTAPEEAGLPPSSAPHPPNPQCSLSESQPLSATLSSLRTGADGVALKTSQQEQQQSQTGPEAWPQNHEDVVTPLQVVCEALHKEDTSCEETANRLSTCDDSVLFKASKEKCADEHFHDESITLYTESNADNIAQSDTVKQLEECSPLPHSDCKDAPSRICDVRQSTLSIQAQKEKGEEREQALSVEESKEKQGEEEEEKEEEEKRSCHVYLKQEQDAETPQQPLKSNSHTHELSDHEGQQNLKSRRVEEPKQHSPTDITVEDTDELLSTQTEPGDRIEPGANFSGLESHHEAELLQADIIATVVSDLRTIEITLDTHSTLSKQVQSQLAELEPRCCGKSSHSDPNNNTKAVLGPSGVVSAGCNLSPERICIDRSESGIEDCDRLHTHTQTEATQAQTTDLALGIPNGAVIPAEEEERESEDLLCPLDFEPYWSSEDSALSGLGDEADGVSYEFTLGEGDALAELAQQQEYLESDNHHCHHTHPPRSPECCEDSSRIHSGADTTHTEFPQPQENGDDRESLACFLDTKNLLLDNKDADEREGLPYKAKPSPDSYSTDTSVDSSSSDCPEWVDYSAITSVTSSHVVQTSVRIVRHPYPDLGLGLLLVPSLEPILETERSQENSVVAEDDKLKSQVQKKGGIGMKPAGEEREVRDAIVFSSDMPASCLQAQSPADDEAKVDFSCPEQTEQPCDPSAPCEADPARERVATLQPDEDVTAERRKRSPTTSSQDLDTTSTNSEETDELCAAHTGGGPGLHKSSKNKGKGSNSGKGSKFSVFAKMPSFRKGKSASKDARKVQSESSDGGVDLLFYRTHSLEPRETERDNSDDDVFYKGDILNQTVQQAFSASQDDGEEDEDHGFFPSAPRTRHVRQLYSQGREEADKEGSPESAPGKMSPAGQEALSYKRSKSSDSLSLRLRFAQAHKSLSSLFESRGLDKENEEQGGAPGRPEGEEPRGGRQSWKKLRRAKEAELLRRTMSVPESDHPKGGTRQVHSDYATRSAQERLSTPGTPGSPRALCHTDPLTKRGLQQDGLDDLPQGSKSEGRRRKAPPNGLSISFLDSGPPSSDDSEAPTTHADSSPLSPMSPGSLASLAGHVSARSPGTCDGVDGPIRPMSPKPHMSPRPAGQRRAFRYGPARSSALSLILLGQGMSVEALSEPPERPKTLKPKAGPMGSLSPLSPMDPLCPREDGSLEGQSQNSLVTSTSSNDFEARTRLSLSAMDPYSGTPLRAHSFSQSTPIGLDCLGWRRRMSYPSASGTGSSSSSSESESERQLSSPGLFSALLFSPDTPTQPHS
ncbi:hypothetical protein ACEWY4_018872 [Coilia grayii]|uniref:Uncharacterized protein n=1 Tax=Coilia grayii TaxID=363190 RepID=A0ABD1JEF3_9TELE